MKSEIQADAAVLQERDGFTGNGWIKVLAPAKVNLHLAIGPRRADGYHEAISIMHALALHDVVYLRNLPASEQVDSDVRIRMVGCGDVEAPKVAPEKNIAVRAARALRAAIDKRPLGASPLGIDIRIEKNIPSQAGLGGGSTDAAAVLLGLAKLWNADLDSEALSQIARTLGADVPFFLRGGCAYLDGAGRWTIFKSITWPLMKPITFFIVITGIIGGSQMIVEPQIMAPLGGENYSAATIVFYIWQKAFGTADAKGFACAAAWVLALIIFIATAIQFKFGPESDNYLE